MNGGRSYVTIVFGFLCFASVFGQDAPKNCSFMEFYCPKTKTCDTFLGTTCDTSVCGRGGIVFPCEDGEHCYQLWDRCDTVKDCLNGADEMFCSSYRSPSSQKCLYSSRDSLNCKATTTTVSSRCYSGQKECDSGRRTCYYSFQQCDGISQCADDTDERNCGSSCGYGEHACNDGSGCYSSSSMCDGITNCLDSTDEKGCSESSGGIPNGAIIGAVVATVFVSGMIICCKKIMQQTRTHSSPQGPAAYHSAANYRAANSTFQSSHTYNDNSASQPHSPQTNVNIPPAPSGDGTNGDPYAVPPYSPTPYPPSAPSAPYGPAMAPFPSSPPEGGAPLDQPPATAPPPAYDSLFPSK